MPDAASSDRVPETLSALPSLPYGTTGMAAKLDLADPEVLALAATVLADPLLLQGMCDRVYALMQEELRWQQERQGRRSGRG